MAIILAVFSLSIVTLLAQYVDQCNPLLSNVIVTNNCLFN